MPHPAIDPLALARNAKPRSPDWGRAVYLIACLTALILAVYLTALKLTGRISDLAGCGGEGGCANILGGQWANWFRVPISLWAIGIYVPLLLLGVLGLTTPWRRRLAFVGSSILVAAACWFLFLQAIVERQFCPYCFALHACGIIAFTYALSRVWVGDLAQRAGDFFLAGGGASLAMIALVAGQLLGPQPTTHEITLEDGLATGAPAGVTEIGSPNGAAAGSPDQHAVQASPAATAVKDASPSQLVGGKVAPNASSAETSPGDRVVDYFDGAIRWPLSTVPLIGRPDARHILLKYFDYTCSSCRRMHDDLAVAIATYPDDLAVIVIPCPLNPACNPYFESTTKERRGPESHEYACELARLGLSVWRAAPTKFEKFHNELFARQGRVTPHAATLVAESLVGEEELRSTASDPWIEAMLKQSTGVYGQMKQRNPRMPKLLLGGRKVLHGVAADSTTFLNVLREQFQLDADRAGN